MGLFDRKERFDLLQKTQYNLEQSQKNLDTYSQLVVAERSELKDTDEKVGGSEIIMEDEINTPLMAAYALNLCTVSVTQIIDYMDLNVMEQEYDMILNNLNLQNMPDNDALLDILKQILNTVTFFKIDQKEREFVERDYQQKMKNAVWSAVPNVGALIATGLSQGPAMMAVSITASVGTAYMSYRKQKAENKLVYEREMWQLEKSAIEQFDGLKRELFDTAWRLSKHYRFEDKYRLSERQIHQYNAILMDPDDDRRYARLEAISDSFMAYPPFWYQFGHTANLVAISAHNQAIIRSADLDRIEACRTKSAENDDAHIYKEISMIRLEIEDLKNVENEYRVKAKNHFENYQACNQYGLLREDKIASMCELEYVELLLQMGTFNKEDLLMRLAIAAEKAGNSLEVLQLCIFAYMKLGEADLAEKYLKMLVNEDYNRIMNAQILSSLYVHQFFNNINRADARWNYSVLKKRVPAEYLFPMPSDVNADKGELEKQFIYIQKFSLLKKYEIVFNGITRVYAIRFNKCIPCIDGFKYDEKSFEDTYESRSKMKDQISSFVARDKNEVFISRLMQQDIIVEYILVIQEYFSKLCELLEDRSNPLLKFNYQCLQEDLLSPISKSAEEIEKFRLSIQDPNAKTEEIVNELFGKYTFMFFAQEMLDSFTEMITEKVQNLNNMNDISSAEALLLQFCYENNIVLPTDKFVTSNESDSEIRSDFLLEQLMGNDEYNKLKAKNSLRNELVSMIAKHCRETKLIKRENKSRLFVRGLNDTELEHYINRISGNRYFKSDVLAVIEERGLSKLVNDTDLWLTTEGIVIVKSDKFDAKCTSYGRIRYDEDGIICGSEKYTNSKDVDIIALQDLIKEIQRVTEEQGDEDGLKNIGYSNHCFEAIGGMENPILCMN
ncbi:hypothetical protein R2R35_08840 [Anaerocolumna sp. AGMB13020]|uniref:hypothetical protein n=1 Tax=Anaerocolumna sp. AGMB13020 TaxID=3081750 RepID=UPI00295324E0|nr:hypothetical protein [Anaerocolumna sp. AGMB13020]WOO38595.1 hypothetical protein R2R35_08840 [Anaerocolumna sp. AGMB13020]